MPLNHKHAGRDRAVLLTLFTLALFADPAVSWLLDAGPPWYLPYLIWLAVITLTAWQGRRPRRSEQRDDR